MNNKLSNSFKRKKRQYKRRKHRTNTVTKADSDRPRLVVTRSNKYIYGQVVNEEGHVLAAADDKDISKGTKSEKAYKVGEAIAEQAIENDVKEIVFDRNGFLYHGRVKQLAEGARAGGLDF